MIQRLRHTRWGFVAVLAALALLTAGYCTRAGLSVALAADEKPTPMELAGKVKSGASRRDRHVQVVAGTVEVTLNVVKDAQITAKEKKISVHDIKAGSYVWARGNRQGNTRLETVQVIVIGDRYDFMNSKYGKVSGETGYIRSPQGAAPK